MRVLLTGIPSYLQRTVAGVSGAQVRHRPYFEEVRTKKDLIDQVRKIANTGNYLIGEGAANSLKAHDVTYVPFWHLAQSRDSDETFAALNEEFDICVFASANLLRPGYSADVEAEVFRRLDMPIVVMGIGIQRKEGLKDALPAGTQAFLDVLRGKESFFLTRGYFTAEFLREAGMKFVKPTGCPSLYYAPAEMRRSLGALADPGLAEAQKISFGGYLGSVADTIVDAHALLKPDSVANYVIQDEVVAYNLGLPGADDMPAYDRASARITAATEYKHAEKWQRKYDLLVFFDTNQWRSWVSSQDLCFGRRFHGSIIGMQAGVPALMIAVDDRMREMLEFIGFPYIEAAVWNRETNKKAYLGNFLSKIDTQAVIDRYSACEANFRSALKHVGL
ncbi:polysaccharide pyruvyl transferase family protein [Nitratireductor sp. ZSWI3]|uniref:polysaccharide pyruvyl transferase family protein n=1 Tax=Nitratireductor sp. ZSWI3 TaxID=2966359 RepID=UPI00214F967F|nr:polysaccharide pyruvyl transferase family protein [Nitratireductor sp. ZSWI3]MCR4266041.1 polysaccharide pyruvyl transferase family protein [Nitratireductor sp. ZSWI3]